MGGSQTQRNGICHTRDGKGLDAEFTCGPWFIDTFSSEEASIKSPAEYARYVNDGTGPYTITPNSAKALYWEGASHPVKVVHHPGIKGQHFVENSINDVSGRLDGYFLRAISEVLG